MTQEEKRSQRAHLVIEIEDAEAELAHEQERAIRIAQGLRIVAKKLEGNADLVPSGEDFSLGSDLRLSPVDQGYMDFVAVASSIESLRVARQNLHNLRVRKRNLDNPGGLRIS